MQVTPKSVVGAAPETKREAPPETTRDASQLRVCSPSKSTATTSSASFSGESEPPGRYHSTIELIVPKRRRVAVT